MKTAELTGAALDWAVAKCEGYQAVFTNGAIRPVFRKGEAIEDAWPNYSTDWALGGPIIEREKSACRKCPLLLVADGMHVSRHHRRLVTRH